MRKIRSILLTGLSALGLTVVSSDGAKAQSVDVAAAELACEKALQIGTIEALEEYLYRYPNAPTACKALAMTSLDRFASSAGNSDKNGGREGGRRSASHQNGYAG
jgi:hypothetical protein